MFNSNPSYFVTGASINFILNGSPDAVARDVNRLFNFGVISNIPDTFKAGESSNVTVQSDKGRVARGFLTIAQNDLRGTMRHVALRSRGKSYVKLAEEADALANFAEIPRFKTNEKASVQHVPSFDLDEDCLPSETLKKLGKEIIAHWFGGARDAASRAANNSAE